MRFFFLFYVVVFFVEVQVNGERRIRNNDDVYTRPLSIEKRNVDSTNRMQADSLSIQPETCSESPVLKQKMKNISSHMLQSDIFEVLHHVHKYKGTSLIEEHTKMVEEYNINLQHVREISRTWNVRFDTKFYHDLWIKLKRFDVMLIAKFGTLKRNLYVDIEDTLEQFKKYGIILNSDDVASLVATLKKSISEKSSLIRDFLTSIQHSSYKLNSISIREEFKYINDHMKALKENFLTVKSNLKMSIPKENATISDIEKNINASRISVKEAIKSDILSVEKSIKQTYEKNLKEIEWTKYKTIFKDMKSKGVFKVVKKYFQYQKLNKKRDSEYQQDFAKLAFLNSIYNDSTIGERGENYNTLRDYRTHMNLNYLFDQVKTISKKLSELESRSEFVKLAEMILTDIHPIESMLQKFSSAVSYIEKHIPLIDDLSNVIQKDLNKMMYQWLPYTESKIDDMVVFIQKLISCWHNIIQQ